ncbi:nitrate/nitrite transporter [Labedaea rhizosphaerae]|uniref:NNP family nitrate/nitrite transporter-like MFS transporter n=1 Tax=Labedaea rhizosphaerae TaxID=598644 RepID=A0A4R6RT06_LABRH|nr:nitrate/nitrite transporter [Labedaea rhizosphaerae]TDP89960.1 NNP family nitrate/nitrite transporter-like MFS transporter [Labedaea rhizosphaerae]
MRKHWIEHWEPENEQFWASTGKKVATRNLWLSIFAEHLGFSVWTMWSVLVLFLGKDYGFSPADKFLLTTTPALVGAVLRVPYTFAVARFGGRNWTIFSASLLIVPCILIGIVLEPGVSLSTLIVVAAVAGVGGGNFASSMTNINTFYPERLKGWALGLNAGGGNVGVAVVQLLGLAVIATAGVGHPKILLWIYVPLVVLAALAATLYMDNLATVRNDKGAARLALTQSHTWTMAVLYIGTFGSFIGYSFAFGQVLTNEFHKAPLDAAYWTFIGPLVGSLIRPIGGRLADRIGGSIVTFWTFAAMAAGCVLVIVAGTAHSFPLYLAGFLVLFVGSGVGNGSTYKMIPAIFQAKARGRIAEGADEQAELLTARRISGAVIGLVSAIGALGGVFINIAFRQSFLDTGSGTAAVLGFLAFYALCFGVTWAVYLRKAAVPESTRAVLTTAGV